MLQRDEKCFGVGSERDGCKAPFRTTLNVDAVDGVKSKLNLQSSGRSLGSRFTSVFIKRHRFLAHSRFPCPIQLQKTEVDEEACLVIIRNKNKHSA